MNFKKMLAAVGLLTVAVPTSLSVVACGTNADQDSDETKTELNTVIKVLTIDTVTDENQVIDAVLALNQNPDLTGDDLEIKAESFHTPGYDIEGSAVIVAKSDSKFTGEVTITITSLEQTNLNSLADKRAQGNGDTKEFFFQEFLTENNITDLTIEQVDLSNFTEPELTGNSGSLTISVKIPNIKYTGTVTIVCVKTL